MRQALGHINIYQTTSNNYLFLYRCFSQLKTKCRSATFETTRFINFEPISRNYEESLMKHRIARVLFALTFVFTWLGFHSTPAYAASCLNVTCEGLNPSTMGCATGAVTSGSVKILSDGGNNQSYVETRKSSACDAKWARTTNKSGAYRYAAASLRYGCTNYCYSQSVRSPGTIANLATVYTPMHAYAATPTRSCGAVSVSSPINIPLSISSSSCTGAN